MKVAPLSMLLVCGVLGPLAAADGRFTPLGPDITGIAMRNTMDVNHPLSYLYHSGMTCGGVVVHDLNGDGFPDLVFGGGRGASRLYVHSGREGEIRYTDATEAAGFRSGGGENEWVAGVAAGDVDGDGRTDLLVCRYLQPNQLWRNVTGADGKVRLVLAPADCGLGIVDCSHSAAFMDYDGDGDLDVYVLTNRIEDPQGTRGDLNEVTEVAPDGGRRVKAELERHYAMWRYDYDNWGAEAVGTPDRLLRNDTKDGVIRFTDVTAAAGIEGRGDGLSATWWDFDRDGWPDLHVGNDFISPDKLYRNNGDGTFTDVIAAMASHTPWFSMGADAGDLNNDLLPDLLVADMSATSHFKSKTTMGVMGGLEARRAWHAVPQQQMQNTLLLGTGMGRFREVARLCGVSSTDWTWAVKFGDYDLDGQLDIYFTNGISRHMNDSDVVITREMLTGRHLFDFWKEGAMRKEKNRAYRNAGGLRFEEVSDAWGLGHEGVSYGAAWGDLDRDGDLDLVTVNLEEPNLVHRNDLQRAGNWLLLDLKGPPGNPRGFGAEVTVRTKAGRQLRQLSPQTGYLSCNEPVVHFGLGSAESVEEVKVSWPPVKREGSRGAFTSTVLRDVPANRRATVAWGDGDGLPERPAESRPAPVFRQSEVLAGMKYPDKGWEDDFRRHTLLPHSYSQLGPCMAWADVNGDRHADVFLGGSAGEMAQLRLSDGKGGYTAKWTEAFRADKDCEDSGAVFFDADGDGDADLCVVCGSNEFTPDAREQRARLYLNDGRGAFGAAPDFPDIRVFAGCVAAGDVDQDGRIDLFIGARCRAQDWPRSDRSLLLRNEGGGRFAVATEQQPALAAIGLVSAAVWLDADADGWADLALAGEWGPVRLLRNARGKLEDATAALGMDKVTGWWQCLTAADVDGDGRMDLVAGNIGLNTKYKAPDAKKPMLTYYGRFDDSGRCQVVEVKRERNGDAEVLYPERGRSCSSTAMPFIRAKFPTFRSFASASLTQVYSEDLLKGAERFEANEFRSGVWRNQGGQFAWQPFIHEAQDAPVFAVVAHDFTGDGHPELFLAQNWLHGPQIETPRYDNGLGLLLENDGTGAYRPMPAWRSGIAITGCMKSAAVQDVNGDGRPDLVVGRNGGSVLVLERR